MSRMTTMTLKLVTVGLAACLFFCRPLLGFDPRTHVWVGQQVLNDVVPDGKVTVDGFDYEVDPHIVEALRKHPSIYRMGHIGPDGSPDALVGQTIVHPGIENGWQTDDWLKWVLERGANSEQGIAYSYGFVGHAAGDMIMHTYVNAYAGDYFTLTDGETDAEVRHYTLEHFVGDHTPPIRNHFGQYLGNPDEIVTLPASFVADTFIVNKGAIQQYKKYLLTTAHLVAMHEVKHLVRTLRSEVESLEIPINEEIENVLRLIGDAERRLAELKELAEGILPRIASQRDAVRIARIAVSEQRKIVESIEVVDRQLRDKLAEADRALEWLEDKVIEANEYIDRTTVRAIDEGLRGIRRAEELIAYSERRIPHWQGQISHWEGRIGHWRGRIRHWRRVIDRYPACNLSVTCRSAKASLRVVEENLRTVEANLAISRKSLDIVRHNLAVGRKNLAMWRRHVELWEKSRREWIAARKKWIENRGRWREHRRNILKQLAEVNVPLTVEREKLAFLEKRLEEAEQALAKLEQQLETWRQEIGQLEDRIPILQARSPKLEDMLRITQSLSAFFTNWDNDLASAIDEYCVATSESIRAAMRHEGIEGMLRPLEEWQRCWLPVFTGLPREIPNTVCQAEYVYSGLVEEVHQLRQRAQELVFEVAPVLRIVKQTVDDLKEDLKNAAIELGDKWVPRPLRQYYRLKTRGTDERTLNTVFSTDNSGKQLLTFDRISTRINRDLGRYHEVRYQNRFGRQRRRLFRRWRQRRLQRTATLGPIQFDPQAFAVAVNAVRLSKLTLLGAAELNRIPSNYGVSAPFDKYGDSLYPTDGTFVNVLYRSVRSIDGNHSWRGNALPPLRRYGCDDSAKVDFGYPWQDSAERRSWGFRLWEDESLRENAFSRIFRTVPIDGDNYVFPSNLVDMVPEGYPQCDEATADVPPKAKAATAVQDFTDRRAELDDLLHREVSDAVGERTELDIQAARKKLLNRALEADTKGDTNITGLLQDKDVKRVMDIPLPTPVPDNEPGEPPADD